MTLPTWHRDAACVDTDPEAWFPPKGEPAKTARRICAACPVRTDCLQWAIDHRIREGIWGGLGPKARDELARRAAA